MTSVNFHNVTEVKSERGDYSAWLKFRDEDDSYIAIHIPRHVAEHAADAYNRAAQAVAQKDGSYRYDAGGQCWLISQDGAKGTVWLAQSDEVTGDQDPAWLFAEGDSLFDVMDAIDNTIEEHSCTRCNELVGDEHLTQTGGADYLCDTCCEDMHRRDEAMREAADDDKAHAMRDVMRGL